MARKGKNQKPTDVPDRLGRTLLHYAAVDGNAVEVSRLLSAGADPNRQDKNGWSALHFAAQASSPECTKILLDNEADPGLTDAYGNSALHRAVAQSRGEGIVIALLRQAGADPKKANAYGVSPVSLARTIANYDVAQYFKDIEKYESDD